jgi:hypothetical protein
MKNRRREIITERPYWLYWWMKGMNNVYITKRY